MEVEEIRVEESESGRSIVERMGDSIHYRENKRRKEDKTIGKRRKRIGEGWKQLNVRSLSRQRCADVEFIGSALEFLLLGGSILLGIIG